jgi:ketosteroid isomerase-like protein
MTRLIRLGMTAEISIRLRRAEFNRAIAAADIAAIGAILSPDVVMVTGTDSAVVSGRKAQLLAWKREFSAKPRMVYTRTADVITSSAVEPIAMEHGHWQGVLDGQDAPMASGTYAAKWREVGGVWMLIAEIFVTLH